MSDNALLPSHVEDSVRAIEQLHVQHHSEATPVERGVERMTGLLGGPPFLALLTSLILLWIAGNLILLRNGNAALDVPPFPWLQGVLTLMALYMATLILITQRRAGRLAAHRAQMTLQLGILSEQKAAKIIALLEELRRDSPEIHDRVDAEAKAMATPADPKAVSEALRVIQPVQMPSDEAGGEGAH